MDTAKLRSEAARSVTETGRECCHAPWTCCDPAILLEAAAEIELLQAALKRLTDKLELCHADKQYEAVWTLYHSHGGRYAGPTYTEELAAAKATLALEQQASEK